MAITQDNLMKMIADPSLPSLLMSMVESRLSVSLPTQGYLAGQAVGSALMELCNVGNPVYNDADVFLSSEVWRALYPSYTLSVDSDKGKLAKKVLYSVEELAMKEYQELGIASRFQYKVCQSRVEGNLNLVETSFLRSVDQGLSLISGFDINSTMVAVDLSTQTLITTPAFLKFLVSGQLRVEQMFTPVHSLLRFLKKLDTLQVFGNVEGHIEMARRRTMAEQGSKAFAAVRLDAFCAGKIYVEQKLFAKLGYGANGMPPGNMEWAPNGTGVYGAPVSFGGKYRNLWNRYHAEMSTAFNLHTHPDKELYVAEAAGSATEAESLSVGCVPVLKDSIQGGKAVNYFWGQWLPAKARVVASRKATSEFVASLGYHASSVKMAINLKAYEGQDYMAGARTGDAEFVRAILVEHEELDSLVAGKTLRQQAHAFRQVIRQFKEKEMPVTWGLFRGVTAFQFSRYLDEENGFFGLIDRHLARMGTLVTHPLPVPSAVGEVAIHELLAGRDLVEEGSRMSHCVGGYTEAIRTNVSRILHFSAGPKATDCATVEWCFRVCHELPPLIQEDGTRVYPLQANLQQARTFGNQTPLPNVLSAEVQARAHVNDWLAKNVQEGHEMCGKR